MWLLMDIYGRDATLTKTHALLHWSLKIAVMEHCKENGTTYTYLNLEMAHQILEHKALYLR